jgi:Xaa-Pro aminopeptidase
MNFFKDRIDRLRNEMAMQSIDVYVVTGTDPHQSEYLADNWNVRKYLSGFTGSAGQMVITKDFAGLWTDSRYFIQAEYELKNTGIQLMKQKVQFAPEYLIWIKDNIPEDCTVLIDGSLISLEQFEYASKTLLSNFKLITSDKLLGKIWVDRKESSVQRVFLLEDKYAGENIASKMLRIQNFIVDSGINGMLFSALDDIAWITNLRGYDVPFNPVFLSYLYFSEKRKVLFVNSEKLSDGIRFYLSEQNIEILPYHQVFEFLNQLPSGTLVGMDKNQSSFSIAEAAGKRFFAVNNPVIQWKSEKNKIEINNTRKAMIADGVALTKTFFWLENELKSREVTEYELGQQLSVFRSQNEEYLMDSFGSIVGYMGNGAIIHYSADVNKCAAIRQKGIVLVDSGGQYKTGTTDITRTIATGQNIDDEIKKAFTLVLKGMIALSNMIFPKGTTGVQLDVMARQFLWGSGLNYAHGTGHGVGFCLNVHEGPQGFAGLNSIRGKVPFAEGMITSNEPGFYEPGKFGIRTENLILTKKHPIYDNFYTFETLTLYPLDKSLMDMSMLTHDEKYWVNQYHQDVFDQLTGYLDDNHRMWLYEKCKSLE